MRGASVSDSSLSGRTVREKGGDAAGRSVEDVTQEEKWRLRWFVPQPDASSWEAMPGLSRGFPAGQPICTVGTGVVWALETLWSRTET